jgi:hypothetical protein
MGLEGVDQFGIPLQMIGFICVIILIAAICVVIIGVIMASCYCVCVFILHVVDIGNKNDSAPSAPPLEKKSK